ncbi:MAG: hypothetical protein FWG22_07030 [Prolixibacteraceae bacterium]|nr:hypothetical protein [Prolixibacteraceae bacterium]
MKTILFSAIFYLIGVKVGNTIDLFMGAVSTSKTQMTQSVPKAKKPERAFYMQSEDSKEKKINRKIHKTRRTQTDNGKPQAALLEL